MAHMTNLLDSCVFNKGRSTEPSDSEEPRPVIPAQVQQCNESLRFGLRKAGLQGFSGLLLRNFI